MKFSCTQENLNLGVNLVSHISSRGGGLPILNNILLQCKLEGIYLTATNLEIGLKYLVRGKVIEEGEFTVPARLFSDYIGLLSDKIDVDLDDQIVKIKAGHSSSTIKGLPASDFPPLPRVENGKKLCCQKEGFIRVVEQVVFAASQSETRPELTGVFFQLDAKNQKITLAATDSYRLAEGKIETKTENKEPLSLIVPSRALMELVRILNLLKTETKEIMIEIGSNQIVFLYDNIELISRLIDGAYPDYAQIIPKEFKTELTVSREGLIKTIKAASLFSRSGIYDIVLSASPDKGLKIGSANTQLGDYDTIIEAETKGEENTVVFNYRYLLDGLQIIKTPKLRLQMIDSNNPCLFTSPEEQNYLYIVMPIRQ